MKNLNLKALSKAQLLVVTNALLNGKATATQKQVKNFVAKNKGQALALIEKLPTEKKKIEAIGEFRTFSNWVKKGLADGRVNVLDNGTFEYTKKSGETFLYYIEQRANGKILTPRVKE